MKTFVIRFRRTRSPEFCDQNQPLEFAVWRRILSFPIVGAFLNPPLAVWLMLAACNVTARAETGCSGSPVPANINCWEYQCMNAFGQCQTNACDADWFYWDDITVRLRPGYVADTYFVNGTDRWCATRSYEVHLAPNGGYNITGGTIGEYSPNGVGYFWFGNRFNLPPGDDISVVADGIHMAGMRDCHGAGVTRHGKLLVTIGPAPAPDENQTKQCDLSTSGCSGSGCSGGPMAMAKYSIHLMLASLHIEDTPISYSSPRGPSADFKVVYNQREANQPASFDYGNLGPRWTHNWLSYVTDDGPVKASDSPSVYVRGGGTEKFSGFDSGTNSYAPDRQTLAVLVWMGDGTYEKRFPDGSKEIFTRSDKGSPRRVFLTSVVDAAGNAITLEYDEILRITAITDSLGQPPTTFEYTERWKIATVTDPFGRSAHFEYKGENGQLSKITDPIGIESQFEYEEGTNFIKTMTTPYGSTTFATGQNGASIRWLEATDPEGGKERVEYNAWALNYPSSESSAPSGVHNSDLHFQNTFYWDKTAMSEAPGDYSKAQVFHWLETPDGKVSGIKHSEKKALESRVWYTYKDQADPVKVGKNALPIEVARLVGLGTRQLYQYSYNALGHVLKETDPADRVKIYDYDTNNIDVVGIYQRNLTTGLSFDPVDNLAADKIAAYTNDNSLHKPLTETDAAGQVTTYTYNSFGQILTRENAKHEITTYVYGAGNTTTPLGYLEAIIGPAFNGSSAMTTFTYDEAHRVQTETNLPDQSIVTTNYDAIDRKTTVTYDDGTYEAFQYTDNLTNAMTLDLTASRDRLGRWTYRHYNGNRQMDSITDPLGRTTEYWWCTCGSLMGFNDPNGNSTAFNRDLQNRVYQKYTSTSTITYEYENLTSRLASSTLGYSVGRRTNYSYDVDDNINSISYDDTSGSSNPPTPSVSYTYDNHNRVKTMTVGGTDDTIYDYNTIPLNPTLGAGKLHTIDGPLSDDTITFAYDELGRVITQGIEGGEDSVVHYDSLGRVSWTENALGHFDHTYAGVTPRLTQTVAQAIGQTTNYVYFGNDHDRRLQTLENLAVGGANLSKFDYTYDAEGQIMSWNRQLGTATSGRWFQYDDARQLLFSRNASDPLLATDVNGYVYDNTGNRTSDFKVAPQAQPLQHTYTINERNQIDSYETSQGPITGESVDLTYDYPGNLTDDGEGKTFEWDAASRLTAVNHGSNRSEFTYDGLSRRVKIVEKSGSTVTSTKLFVWVGNTIAQERASNHTVTRQYFAEGEYRDKPYYYTRDHLGSIRELTNSDGALVARYDYDPYGNRTKLSGTADVDFGYTGHYHHAPSGLNLTLYRAYDPEMGRWISKDPIGENGGINLYGYVSENPVNTVDALGLQGIIVPSGPPFPIPVVPNPRGSNPNTPGGGLAALGGLIGGTLQDFNRTLQINRGVALCGPWSPLRCRCCVVVIDGSFSEGYVHWYSGFGSVVNEPCSAARRSDQQNGVQRGGGRSISEILYYDIW